MIDILIPIYKVNELYINELISSLSLQSFNKFNVLFGYDDDESETVIKNALSKYPELSCRHLRNPNQPGIFSNLNNLLTLVESEYIQLLCQDDFVYRNYLLDNITALLKNEKVDLVFCQADWCDESSLVFKKNAHLNIFNDSQVLYRENLNNYLIRFGCMPGNLSPVMIRRSTFEKVGFFDESLPFAADFDYWCRVASISSFYYIKHSNVCLRKHKSQASVTIGIKQLVLDRINIYTVLLNKSKNKVQRIINILYLNQTVGSNQLYQLIRSKNFKFIINSYQYPFNFILSFLFLLFTLNGRIIYFNSLK